MKNNKQIKQEINMLKKSFYIKILNISNKIIICGVAILFSYGIISAQNQYTDKDSLTLEKIINQVLENHPLIKQSKESLNSSNAKIELAKTSYYPKIEANATYTRLGPVSSAQFGPSTFELYPANNYNVDLEIKQIIYDFGKTSSNIQFESQNRNLTEKSIEQIKQKLAINAISVFYYLVYLQQAIMIKDEELKNLKEHLDFVSKKLATGSAINYEILSTQVKTSNTESQKTDLLSAQKTQLTSLNSLLGQPENTVHNLQPKFTANTVNFTEDSLLSVAFKFRDEIILSQEKTNIAELYYNSQDNSDNPIISAFANGGMKNGIFPEMYDMTANYAVGININVPIFDAFRKKNNLLVAQSSINNSKLETESIKRNITTEVFEGYDNFNAAKKKVEQFTFQVNHAEQAYELAKTNFKVGSITNMDLLDAQTNVSESRLLLLKAKIDYELSVFKLRSALGIRLY